MKNAAIGNAKVSKRRRCDGASRRCRPPIVRRNQIRSLGLFGKAAVVRVNATGWLDYLQEVKWNRRWLIINLVWEDRLHA